MAYKVSRELPCTACGELTNRRQNKTRKPLCLSCAIDVLAANTVQLKAHSGPHYDAWRESMHRRFFIGGTTSTPPPNLDASSS